ERDRRTAAPRPERVQRDPEQVRGRIVDPLEVVPAFPQPQERLLHQLFRIVPIAGDEVESLEEAFVFLREERVESGPPFGALRGEPDDFTLCSHGPWTHDAHRALTGPALLADANPGGEPGRDPRGVQRDRRPRRFRQPRCSQQCLLERDDLSLVQWPRWVRHRGDVELDPARWKRLWRRGEEVPPSGPEPFELRGPIHRGTDAQREV